MKVQDIKDNLNIEEVFEYVEYLGGNPEMRDEYFVSQTICHNNIGEGSYKLYYYENTKLFHCYSGCEDPSFDIFQLTIKVYNIQKHKIIDLPYAIYLVANYFGLTVEEEKKDNEEDILDDWAIFKKWHKKANKNKTVNSYMYYDKSILAHFPKPRIPEWEEEGIKKEICDEANICLDPINLGIVIPHYDMNDNLIGIRERTLIKEQETWGKYRPAIINKKMYNHALGFNLYNLNHSKNNIKILKTALVVESEKSCLEFRSFSDIDISVACCGSNLSEYQINLLLSLGVENIIIGFDKQFQEIGDKEWELWVRKLKKINTKIRGRANVSFLFDKWNILDYKDSPTDKGKEVFDYLFENRVTI